MSRGLRKDSRILVAGHTGLIGSATVRRLRRDGYAHVLTWPSARVDLRRPDDVARAFAADRPEYVVLAAGRVGGIAENLKRPAALIEDNLAIQLHVFQAARATGVQRLIFFGSSCMYPRDCAQPMAEDQLWSGRPEGTSLPYAAAKLAGVQACLAYNAEDGAARFLPVIPATAYGPHDNFSPTSGHVLAALMARLHEAARRGDTRVTLWGSGSPRREFIHADDIAGACVRFLQDDLSGLQWPVNIGSGEEMSIRELAEAIADVVGYRGLIDWDGAMPDGAPRKRLDLARVRAFGWRSTIGLIEGVRSTYEWYGRHAVPDRRRVV